MSIHVHEIVVAFTVIPNETYIGSYRERELKKIKIKN